MTAILWYRRDLRVSDHAALAAAVRAGGPVVPVFILDDEAAGAWKMGGAGRWWLHHGLTALAADLEKLGARLILRRGNSRDILPALARETGATSVHAGVGPEPWMRRLDRDVSKILERDRVRLHLHRTRMMFNPETIRNGQGDAFGVYTPFTKAALATGGPEAPIPAPARISFPDVAPASDTLADWDLLPTHPDWAGGLRQTWTPGSTGARARLDEFLDQALSSYANDRNLPGIASTSMLSPHIVWGDISLNEVWFAADEAAKGEGKGLETFHKELLWREFSTYLLWHHPDLPEKPLRSNYAAMPFRDSPVELLAWQRGQTGIPIIDAAMRQLWQTGWMHNRLRMVTASFLTKHLLVSWQTGEAWFWNTLCCADLSANSASWQWVAGSGADAAPFFRVFNPVLQGKKFDADGAFVRRFVPELARLPDTLLHAPWEASAAELAAAGVTLGKTYPNSIVHLGEGRDRALAAWRGISGTPEYGMTGRDEAPRRMARAKGRSTG